MYLKPKLSGLNMLWFYSPPEHTNYQPDVALYHVTAYKHNVEWLQTILQTGVIVNVTKRTKKAPIFGACSSINI